MTRKRMLSAACALLLLACAGCKEKETADSSQISDTTQPATESAEPGIIGYVTGHGETDPAELTAFQTALESRNYTFGAVTLDALPPKMDALILSDPEEDLTKEELEALDVYMDAGGQLLLLMPASDSDTRFKYLGQLLEEFCITLDYDLVTETAQNNMVGGDETFIVGTPVTIPITMVLEADASTYTPFLQNARSFHLNSGSFVLDGGVDFYSFLVDSIVQSGTTAIGAPCGGQEDDPETYENEPLNLMLYSQNKDRNYSSVVCIGANQFLLNENFEAETSRSMLGYVYSTLDWFLQY